MQPRKLACEPIPPKCAFLSKCPSVTQTQYVLLPVTLISFLIHISGNVLGVVSEMRIMKYLWGTQHWDTGEPQRSCYQFCTLTRYGCHVAHGRIIPIWMFIYCSVVGLHGAALLSFQTLLIPLRHIVDPLSRRPSINSVSVYTHSTTPRCCEK